MSAKGLRSGGGGVTRHGDDKGGIGVAGPVWRLRSPGCKWESVSNWAPRQCCELAAGAANRNPRAGHCFELPSLPLPLFLAEPAFFIQPGPEPRGRTSSIITPTWSRTNGRVAFHAGPGRILQTALEIRRCRLRRRTTQPGGKAVKVEIQIHSKSLVVSRNVIEHQVWY